MLTLESIVAVGRELAPVASTIASCWTVANTFRLLANQYKQKKLDEEKIPIILQGPTRELILAYRPMRKTLSRAEILGIIGMSVAGVNMRFTLRKLNDVFTDGRFERMMKGVTNALVIQVSDEELMQFVG